MRSKSHLLPISHTTQRPYNLNCFSLSLSSFDDSESSSERAANSWAPVFTLSMVWDMRRAFSF